MAARSSLSTNMHGVVSITVARNSASNGVTWIEIIATDDTGSEFEFTFFKSRNTDKIELNVPDEDVT